MKNNRSLLFLAAAIASVFSFATNATGQTFRQEEGVFCYTNAHEVLRLVNERRSAKGIESLNMTEYLTDAAMKRAAEIAVEPSQTRPNGDSYDTAFSWAESSYVAENMAYGRWSPAEAMIEWTESPDTMTNMLNATYVSTGVGCFIQKKAYGNEYYWVQLFSSEPGDQETFKGDLKATVKVSLISGKDSEVNDGRQKYQVEFDPNGGSGVMSIQKMTCDIAEKIRKNAFTYEGYVFTGWAKEKEGKAVYTNAASVKNLTTSGETVTLYATWAKKKYKVAFNANGGKLPKGKKMAAQTFTYGKAQKLRKNVFTRDGYVFLGWAKSQKGAVAYKNAASVKNLSTTGATVRLYAKWAKKSYKVAFYANGGKGKMDEEKFTYGKAKKLSANKFKRSGYTFKGWAKSKKGAVVYKNKAEVKNLVKNGKTVKLYAKWKRK